MHKDFKFPVECSFKQTVFHNVKLKGDTYISEIDEENSYHAYEVFNFTDTIPALAKLGRKKTIKQHAILSWIEQYGFLSSPPIFFSIPIAGDNFYWFVEEARHLAKLWGIYRDIVNRNEDNLYKLVRFEDAKFFIHGSAQTKSVIIEEGNAQFSTNQVYFYEDIPVIENEPLPYYQYAALYYLKAQVEKYLKDLQLTSMKQEVISLPRQDDIKATPILRPANLLQAIYLQFFIILSGDNNRKVCKICGDLFKPNRRDEKYCSSRCRKTGKSQRHRDNIASKSKEREK